MNWKSSPSEPATIDRAVAARTQRAQLLLQVGDFSLELLPQLVDEREARAGADKKHGEDQPERRRAQQPQAGEDRKSVV